jgi:hypothetical protein
MASADRSSTATSVVQYTNDAAVTPSMAPHGAAGGAQPTGHEIIITGAQRPVPFFSDDSSCNHVAMASSLPICPWPVTRRCKFQMALFHVHGNDP